MHRFYRLDGKMACNENYCSNVKMLQYQNPNYNKIDYSLARLLFLIPFIYSFIAYRNIEKINS